MNKIAEVQDQISELAAKMEVSNKAMKTLAKIHRAMCVKDAAAEKAAN
jgi:hypothetical protein